MIDAHPASVLPDWTETDALQAVRPRRGRRRGNGPPSFLHWQTAETWSSVRSGPAVTQQDWKQLCNAQRDEEQRLRSDATGTGEQNAKRCISNDCRAAQNSGLVQVYRRVGPVKD